MGQYNNDLAYILYKNKQNYILQFKLFRIWSVYNVTVIRVPACVNNNNAVFTNPTDIGKLYTGLNPLYSPLRFIAIFTERKHCSFQLT